MTCEHVVQQYLHNKNHDGLMLSSQCQILCNSHTQEFIYAWPLFSLNQCPINIVYTLLCWDNQEVGQHGQGRSHDYTDWLSWQLCQTAGKNHMFLRVDFLYQCCSVYHLVPDPYYLTLGSSSGHHNLSKCWHFCCSVHWSMEVMAGMCSCHFHWH